MRWSIPIGVSLGIGIAYAARREAILRLLRRLCLGGAPAPSGSYLKIRIPFRIKEMHVDAARKIADAVRPASVVPQFMPPALKFTFQPIRLDTRFIQFRWQPPAYVHKLTGGPSQSTLRGWSKVAYEALYKTKMEKEATGWKITLTAEVPI